VQLTKFTALSTQVKVTARSTHKVVHITRVIKISIEEWRTESNRGRIPGRQNYDAQRMEQIVKTKRRYRGSGGWFTL
jgi:hypothetical protein